MWMLTRAGIVVLVLLLAGCGGSGLEGTLSWEQGPTMSRQAVSGSVKNTTSHSVTLNAKAMRLLDDRGRKLGGRIRVARAELASGESTSLRATWKSGNPVRIDYGAGTLALPSE
jgi:hypothetical protein